MGMMARMRSLAPWFIITVGGLFVIFMIFSDTRMGGLFGKNEAVIGSVDGEDIKLQEFNVAFDNQVKQQEAQTGRKFEEDQLDYFREQMWNTVVSQKLMAKKIKEYGIVVSDEEVKDFFLGPNPPAELAQSFTDSTGKFDRASYERALKDPKVKDQVIVWENIIREQLLTKKLQQFVTSAVNVSEDEIRRQYEDQSIKMRADYTLFDLNNVPDNDIKVSDDDLRNYYNKHMSDFKMDAQRKIKYVLFNRKATAQDSARIKDNLQKNIVKMQKDTASIKSLVAAYSDYPYSKDTLNVMSLPAEAKSLLVNAKANEFVGPVVGPDGYTVYHMVAKVKGKDPSVKVSHILVKTGADEKASKAKADDIYNQLQKGANFAELAKKYSEDPGSASNGGDAGWGTKGSWVNEFYNAAASGKVGQIQKPVKSSFGFHIIKVTDRSDDRFVVEKIASKIAPSPTTLNKIVRNANELVKLSREGDFQKEAEMLKYNVVETPAFTEKAGFISPLGYNPSLVTWAFSSKVGEISEYFKTPTGYVVAMVSADIKAGVKPFEDLKESVKINVIKEKKLEKMMQAAADAKAKLGGNSDLKAVSNFYPNVKADTTTEFSGTVFPNVGRDFAFIQYCQKAELNKVSAPVKGLRGAYLIKPVFRTQFNEQDYTAQRNAIRDRLLQQKKSQSFNQWLAKLREDVKVVDERYKYYR